MMRGEVIGRIAIAWVNLANVPPPKVLPARVHPQTTGLASSTGFRRVSTDVLQASPKVLRISDNAVITFLLPNRARLLENPVDLLGRKLFTTS
jgi:hypothetical protein